MNDIKDDVVNIEKETVNIAIFNNTDAALAMLKEKYSKVPDTETPGGYELVKAACTDLLSRRTGLEDARKKAKQPYLDGGRIIDKEAKRITTALVELEEPMKIAKKLVDDREKRQKEERIARLREKVAGIREFVGKARGQESTEVAKLIEEVDAIDCSKDFYDLSVEAAEARTDTLQQMNEIYAERLQFEISENERKELEERQKEEDRKRLIENKINDLKMIPVNFIGKSSIEIGEKLDALSGWNPDPSKFAEYHAEAMTALKTVIQKLEQAKAGAAVIESVQAEEERRRYQQEEEVEKEGGGDCLAEIATDRLEDDISPEEFGAIKDGEPEKSVDEIITRFFAGFAEFNPQQAEAITEVIMSDSVPGVTITVTKER